MSRPPSLTYVYLTVLIIFICTSLQRPYVPLFAIKEVGATLVEAGVIASAAGLTAAFFSTSMGVLTDRFGRKQFIILGSIILSITSMMIAVTSTTFSLLLTYAATGLAMSMMDTSLTATVADLAPVHQMGRAFGYFSTALQTASTIGPALGGFLILLLGFRSTFLAVGASAIFGACLAILIPRTSKHHFENHLIIPARRSLKNAHLWLGWLLTLTAALLIGGTSAYFPLYLNELGFDVVTIGLLFTAQSVASALSRPLIGTLIDKHREKETVLVGVLTASTIVSIFPFIQNLFSLTGLLLILGAGIGGIGVVGAVLVAKYAPSDRRGLLLGFSTTFRSLGNFLGPTVIASVMSRMETGLNAFRYGFITLGITALLVASVTFTIVKLKHIDRF